MVKNPPVNIGDLGWIPGSGRSLGKGMATHSSILAWRIPGTKEGAWRVIVHRVAKSWIRLSDEHFHFHHDVMSHISF